MLREQSFFRDPSGFIFRFHRKIFRRINSCYAQHYDLLMASGFYAELTGNGLHYVFEYIAHAPNVQD